MKWKAGTVYFLEFPSHLRSKFAFFNVPQPPGMKHLLAVASCFCSICCFSQTFPPKAYPQGYFRDPLDIPITLAANFGELRSNHYHMGLDIRTQKRVNLPVLAAADGYVARVRIEPEGFGQAIYINHPNGYTTLYAHLNRFFPALADYVKRQQYKLESWKVFLDIPPGLFPVKKGELIAYSGSTGGSEGPHLHFEIRLTAGDINLNPLLFGLPVPDNAPPVILRLAIYDRGRSVYEQSPRIIPVQRMATTGTLASIPGRPESYSTGPLAIVVTFPRVSFAISAFDSQSGSSNPNGIYQAVLYDNGEAVTGFQMDRISYDNTRNLNAHIDYSTKEKGGPYLQHLSRLPGYTDPSIYRAFRSDSAMRPADGVIDLSDGASHAIQIEVRDVNDNVSELRCQIHYRPAPGGEQPLANGLGKEFYPGMLDGFETEDCAFYIPGKGCYDSVYIGYMRSDPVPGGISSMHIIGSPSIPLQDPMLVRIRSERPLSDEVKAKVVMVRTAGREKEVLKPEWQGNWASANFREFGSFRLELDETFPVIIPVGFRDGAILKGLPRIAFRVKNQEGGIRRFRAELDPPPGGKGQWLCFTNDKERAFIYTFDEHCPAGKHTIRVEVEDQSGNSSVATYHFTR
jgi:murein DD-endopeptidase MepM/ murein hydrolase activator NlpD